LVALGLFRPIVPLSNFCRKMIFVPSAEAAQSVCDPYKVGPVEQSKMEQKPGKIWSVACLPKIHRNGAAINLVIRFMLQRSVNIAVR
jgi:hypothetical protein